MVIVGLRIALLLMISVFVVSLQAMEAPSNHSLIDLPLDIQRAIICPRSVDTISITEANADTLKEEIKRFFVLKETGKYFNEKFEWPWLPLSLEQKNRLMEEANLFIKNLIYKEFDADQRAKEKKRFSRFDEDVSYKVKGDPCAYLNLFPPKFSEKVSSGYKKYRLIPLMLVHCGADPDTKDKRSTTCLSKAVHARDEAGAELLLKHHANPMQISECEDFWAAIFLEHSRQKRDVKISYTEGGLCTFELIYRAQTMPMLKLFLGCLGDKKIKSHWESLKPHFDPEVFKYWAEAGIREKAYLWKTNDRIYVLIHSWLIDRYLNVDDIENQLAKIQIALDLLAADVEGNRVDGEEKEVSNRISYLSSKPSYATLAYEPYGRRLVAMLQEYLAKISQKNE